MFKRLYSIGKKISHAVSRAIGFGKKAHGRVQGVGQKILSVAQIAKPFVPQQFQKALDKGVTLTQKAVDINKKVGAGLNRADQLNNRARAVTSVSGGLAVAKEAFHDSKNAIKSTRKMLERNKKSSTNEPTVNSTRMAQRALLN